MPKKAASKKQMGILEHEKSVFRQGPGNELDNIEVRTLGQIDTVELISTILYEGNNVKTLSSTAYDFCDYIDRIRCVSKIPQYPDMVVPMAGVAAIVLKKKGK